MLRAFWIATYRKVNDPARLAAYAKLAGPALTAKGGRFLARGMPAMAYEQGSIERVVLIEFDDVQQAIAAHDSPEYQAALAVLDGAVDRDLRIIECLSP